MLILSVLGGRDGEIRRFHSLCRCLGAPLDREQHCVDCRILRGTLVIDALPWGEVVAVNDAHGAAHAPQAMRHTPLALSLPAGDYTIEVRHPGFQSPLSAGVSVRAGEVTTKVLEFRRIDAADYFRKTGS
jgi:hypothetical protein